MLLGRQERRASSTCKRMALRRAPSCLQTRTRVRGSRRHEAIASLLSPKAQSVARRDAYTVVASWFTSAMRVSGRSAELQAQSQRFESQSQPCHMAAGISRSDAEAHAPVHEAHSRGSQVERPPTNPTSMPAVCKTTRPKPAGSSILYSSWTTSPERDSSTRWRRCKSRQNRRQRRWRRRACARASH